MNSLPVEAQIALACGIDAKNTLRNIAAVIVSRFIMEAHKWGYVEDDQRHCNTIARRFRLGDFAEAMRANFPARTIKTN